MSSPEYTDIDAAYDSAIKTIDTIAGAQGWSSVTISKAYADAKAAYDDNSGAIDSAESFLRNSFGFSSSLLTIASDVSVDQTKRFWTDLYNKAKVGWTSFPNGSKAISWLASAAGASQSAKDELDANKPSTIATGTVVETANDINKIGKTIGNVASNPNTWYALGAAALLGGIVYLRGIFR